MPLLGAAMLASVCTTETLLLLEGHWTEALPLHLCSISALVALGIACGVRGLALDFLWYLGMPGAALGLLFFAPAVSRWQTAFNAAYTATHALILVIPACAIARGSRPRMGRAPEMMALLQGIALLAFAVNRALGTDFLFLMAPPAGTPLGPVIARSYPAYLLALEAAMLALCLTMQAFAGAIARREILRAQRRVRLIKSTPGH